MTTIVATDRGSRWAVPAALAAVYVIWGSTYLAIAFMVDEFPPLLGNSIRFAFGGTLLTLIALRRGRALPTRAEWVGSAQVGLPLLLGGVGMVSIAQSYGVGSGLAATAVAITPLWAGLWAGVFGRWPTRLEWVGMLIGLVGMLILSGEGDFVGNPIGITLIVLAPVSWAFGSIWSSRASLPAGMMATAAQMLAVAPVMATVGVLRGERFDGMPDLGGWVALAYLGLFGSVVALTAYGYLLQNVRPALATSYAYVNPVVAVILGVTIGGEALSMRAVVALPLILLAVGLVLVQQARLRSQELAPAIEEAPGDAGCPAEGIPGPMDGEPLTRTAAPDPGGDEDFVSHPPGTLSPWTRSN